jgi:WD40 repeat protein
MSTDCPAAEMLRHFLDDALPAAGQGRVLDHVAQCPDCQSRLDRLTAEPRWVGLGGAAVAVAQDLSFLASLKGATPATHGNGRRTAMSSGPPTVPGYEIIGELGRGGMGVVYRARQLSLGRAVAVKVVASDTSDTAALDRFHAEAESLAKLRHANVVPVYEAGDAEGRPYLVLELVEGGSLADRLRDGPLPPRDAARLVAGLARGIQAAHAAGVLHRDLKPANVLLAADDGTPKVTDFGLAKRLDSDDGLTATGLVLGTPGYMAPEQAGRDQPVGPTADVYGLGAVLYACLVGRPPFHGPDPVITLWQVKRDDPVSPRRLQPGVARDLETVCLKCLAKDPKRRYAAAADLAEDLDRFLDGRPVRARPSAAWERAAKLARRRPAAALLVAFTLLVAGVGFPAATALWLRADRERIGKERERDRAEAAAYAGRIALASRALDGHDVTEARAHLDRCAPDPGRPDLRGWEWRHLRPLTAADLRPGMRHASGPGWNAVQALAFGPDRRLYSAAGQPVGAEAGDREPSAHRPGELRVWDATDGGLLALRTHHAGAVWAVAVSPDGRNVATGAADGTVRLADAATGGALPGPGRAARPIFSLAFTPAGDLLAVASPDRLLVWDVASGHERFAAAWDASLPKVAFAGDGRQLYVATATAVRAWDVTGSGRELPPLPGPGAWCIAVSPDRPLLALGRGTAVEVWDAERLVPLRRLEGHTSQVLAVAFGPNGRLASGSDDRTVRVWDAETGRDLYVFCGHTLGVSAVAFAADGHLLASGGKDRTVKLWDPTRDPRGLLVEGTNWANGELGEWHRGFGFAAGGRELVAVDHAGTARGYDTATGKLLGEGPVVPRPRGGTTEYAAFAADAGALAVPDPMEPGTVRLWDRTSGPAGAVVTGAARTMAVALSRDGRRLAARVTAAEASDRFDFAVWDVAGSGREVLRAPLPVGEVTGTPAFRADGEEAAAAVLSSAKDRTVSPKTVAVALWDLRTGRERRLVVDDDQMLYQLAYSPDGTRLAAVGVEGLIRIWDVATGRPVPAPPAASAALMGVAYSPDGARLTVSGRDGLVRLYDAATGGELMALRVLGPPGTGHYGYRPMVTFSPDGRRLAANSWDGSITIWDAPPD